MNLLSSYLKFYYYDTKGRATYFSTVEDDSIIVGTYVNAKSSRTYGTDFSLPIMNGSIVPVKLPDWFTMLNISLSYYHLTDEAGYNNDNYVINRNVFKLNGNLTCKLWYEINASAYINYTPKVQDDRFITYSMTYLGVYLSRDFMKNKVQISLGINDILNASHSQSITTTPDFYSYSSYRFNYSPSMWLSFRYNFNDFKMKNERKVDDGRDKTDNQMF